MTAASKRKVSTEGIYTSVEKTEAQKRGKRAKRRGYYFEIKTMEFLQSCGLQADRDGRSGRRDVFFWLPGQQQPRKAESKARKDGAGFKTINNWLNTNDVMVLWENGQPGKVVMTADTFRELVARESMTEKIKPNVVIDLSE